MSAAADMAIAAMAREPTSQHADAGLHEYFLQAASWESDRFAQQRRSARTAWRVAAAGWICAVSASAALIALMPLQRVDPFLIRVDSSTGIVDTVPVYTGTAPQDEAVTRYFLTHYVTVCERFNFATAESDYEECGAFHTAKRNQTWYALWSQTNPSSPLNLHKDGSAVRVQVESLSFLKRANGVSDLAQLRYLKAERAAGATTERFTHWIATIQYAYTAPSADPKTRGWNPLGFKIVEFDPQAEVQTAPAVISAPPALRAVP